MMQRLAAFAMSARWRAVAVAAVSAALAMLAPPLSSPLAYVGAAVIGLVGLRLGAVEGLGVLLAGAGVLAVFGLAAGGLSLTLAVSAALLWLPVWLLALLLRSSRSLALTLQAAAVFGAVLVVLVHGWLGDPAQWWTVQLQNLLAPVMTEHGLDASHLPELARWMTALMVAALVFGVLLSLLLARAWQAGLYNPGGFGAEFRALALGRRFALAALLIGALAALPQLGAVATLAAEMLFTLLLVYLLQGLALVHALVRSLQAQRAWLIGVYVLLVLAAAQVMPLLALLGWMDAWIDVRGRFAGRGRSGER